MPDAEVCLAASAAHSCSGALPAPTIPIRADNDRGMGLPRKRAVLRLLVDLLLTGVYTAHAVLLTCVKQLAGSADFQRDPEGAQVRPHLQLRHTPTYTALIRRCCMLRCAVCSRALTPEGGGRSRGQKRASCFLTGWHCYPHTDGALCVQGALGLLTALAKAGREELLGLAPALPVALAPDSLPSGESGAGSAEAAAAEAYRKAVQRYEAALAARYCLPPEAQVALRTGVERCFQGACVALVAAHATLQETEAENARVLNNRGDLPEDMAAAYEVHKQRGRMQVVHSAVPMRWSDRITLLCPTLRTRPPTVSLLTQGLPAAGAAIGWPTCICLLLSFCCRPSARALRGCSARRRRWQRCWTGRCRSCARR